MCPVYLQLTLSSRSLNRCSDLLVCVCAYMYILVFYFVCISKVGGCRCVYRRNVSVASVHEHEQVCV